MDDSRINNKLPIAKEGFPFILGCGAITCVSFLFGLFLFGLFFCITTLFVIFFFRDPERKSPQNKDAVLAPADGKVLEIRHIQNDNNPLDQEAVKISIFMSVFNVHVNRIPAAGIIRGITYKPGRFLSANLDKASEQNEKKTIILQTPASREIAFIQIAGLIARRIACWIKAGEQVVAGQRFGLIRFGSRVEVFIAGNTRIVVQPGQKVKAGETVLGYLL